MNVINIEANDKRAILLYCDIQQNNSLLAVAVKMTIGNGQHWKTQKTISIADYHSNANVPSNLLTTHTIQM